MLRRLLPRVETVYGKDRTHPDPYLTRVAWGPFFLHVFHRGDRDPDYHDHVRPFWTLPLTGYVEHRLIFPGVQVAALDKAAGRAPTGPMVRKDVVLPFRVHRREADCAHRIAGRWSGRMTMWRGEWEPLPETEPGPIITLGLWDRRPAPREWGFWRRHSFVPPDTGREETAWEWVPWREYVFGQAS